MSVDVDETVIYIYIYMQIALVELDPVLKMLNTNCLKKKSCALSAPLQTAIITFSSAPVWGQSATTLWVPALFPIEPIDAGDVHMTCMLTTQEMKCAHVL